MERETLPFWKRLFVRKKRTGAVRIENGLKCGNPIFAWIMLTPAFLTWAVFWLYVNFDSILLSFQNSSGGWTFDNYAWVIKQFVSSETGDGQFAIALRNTLIYFFTNYLVINSVNVLLAYFFFKKIKGYKFFRLWLYLPNLLAGATLTMIYKELIAFDGPIMDLLMDWGIVQKRLQLLADPKYAMPASVAYSLWIFLGGTFVYASGAMSRIPYELFESAALDGITPLKEVWYIVLPLISQTLSTLYVLGVADILLAGGATLYLTGGNYDTTTLSFWIFWQIYTGGFAGTSCALGLVMTMVTLPLTFFVKWVAGKITPEVTY
ncbi:MAG: sugar ABC transporter permease [Clostridia bacterium]|nr:sugar ABC transporter permease [Clostridia bacterium]